MKIINSLGTQQASSRNLGIRRKIFSASEAEFFFINKAYFDAYDQLLNGIRRHGGFFLLTSEAGIGKTLLLRKLASEPSENLKFAFCYSTNIDYDNLLTVIGDQLGIAVGASSLSNKLAEFEGYLNANSAQGISVALLIDDAHHLNEDVLINLIALSGLKLEGDRALRIVLSGTSTLEEVLKKVRIQHGLPIDIVHVRLEPLTVIDVANYIARQVKNSGALNADSLFPPPVVQKIARYTGGVPRLINSLCERALSITQLYEEVAVTTATIDEAASELMLREKDITPATTPADSLEEILSDDATQVVKSPQRSTFDEDRLGEEIKKIIADSFVVDRPAVDLDETVSEPILHDTSVYPVTAVSFEPTRSAVTNHLVQSIPPSFQNESKLIEESRKNLVETLFDDELEKTALIAVPDDVRLDWGRQKSFRSPRLQILLLVLIALLAGLAGATGGVYLFHIMSAQKPVVSSRSEPAPPAPAQQTSIALPVSDGDKGTGPSPVSAVESPVVSTPMPTPSGGGPEPPVAEPFRSSQAESSSVSATPLSVATSSLGSLTEPVSASVESEPSGDLQSPSLSKSAIDTPSLVAEAETSPISHSASTPATTTRTPLVSSHMSSGDALLARGDVVSARLFYEAAADIGFAAAMTAVGKTYDPVILGQLGIKGFRADPVKAAEWYLKATKAGNPEATEHLEGLRNWLSDSPNLKETDAKALQELLR